MLGYRNGTKQRWKGGYVRLGKVKKGKRGERERLGRLSKVGV